MRKLFYKLLMFLVFAFQSNQPQIIVATLTLLHVYTIIVYPQTKPTNQTSSKAEKSNNLIKIVSCCHKYEFLFAKKCRRTDDNSLAKMFLWQAKPQHNSCLQSRKLQIFQKTKITIIHSTSQPTSSMCWWTRHKSQWDNQ